MGAVTTLVATVAAAAGAVALYRYVDNKSRAFRESLNEVRERARAERSGRVIDYERDPASGVYRPKD